MMLDDVVDLMDFESNVVETDDLVDDDLDKDDLVNDDLNNDVLDNDDLDNGLECTKCVITIGMTYSDVAEIENLYTQYGKDEGFGIRKINSRENVVQFVCHREGFHKSKRKNMGEKDGPPIDKRFTKSNRIGCRASLHCRLDYSTNTWKITKFDDIHNHDMVGIRSRKYMNSHRNMSQQAKLMAEIFDSRGISVSKVVDVMHSNPLQAEFSKKDCYNHIISLKRNIVDGGDAQSAYVWCTRQHERNPDFKYSIQLDTDGRLLNLFWIDARSRVAYEVLGDVVSFDTTYKTNKYSMPFAPFVGIDNHKGTILFGCALLQDETEVTFQWLFETWLHYMNGKQPISFITDQDSAMMNAVRKVFPNSRQRLCLWHITKKFPERLSHIYKDKSTFKTRMNDLIHETLTPMDFDLEWEKIILDYDLKDNEWLKNLYLMRHLWAPVYGRDIFLGGLHTTGRSESINYFFDSFVHSGTTLQEFVVKYTHAVDVRYETLRRAEYDTNHKTLILTFDLDIEKHTTSVYTNAIYLVFVKELKASFAWRRELVTQEGDFMTYRVKKKDDVSNGVLVVYDTSNCDVQCQCKMFEFMGVICKHILSVFLVHSVFSIPQKYIKQRWTQKVIVKIWECHDMHNYVDATPVDNAHLKASFCEFAKLYEKSEKAADLVKGIVDAALAEANAKVNELVTSNINVSSMEEDTDNTKQCSSMLIRDPMVTQTKGRKKSSKFKELRIRSGIELAKDNHVRCSKCKGSGHNRRTCKEKLTF